MEIEASAVIQRVALGLILGIAAAIWVFVYTWVESPHAQALMIFFSIVSATRAASYTHKNEDESTYG